MRIQDGKTYILKNGDVGIARHSPTKNVCNVSYYKIYDGSAVICDVNQNGVNDTELREYDVYCECDFKDILYKDKTTGKEYKTIEDLFQDRYFAGRKDFHEIIGRCHEIGGSFLLDYFERVFSESKDKEKIITYLKSL